MATFKLALGVNDTENSVRFEVTGSDRWVEEVMPAIIYVAGWTVQAHGRDSENKTAIGNELTAAKEALAADKDFHGKFVTVTRSSK